MKSFNLPGVIRASLLIIGLAFMPLAATVTAQNNTQTTTPQNSQPVQGSGGPTSTQTTRTTTTTQTHSTWVDPFWLVLGGIGLLAIIVIVILASRRRGRDRTAVVHERETVIKKE
jgi:hypothetical protein